jgi:hypothetical protein
MHYSGYLQDFLRLSTKLLCWILLRSFLWKPANLPETEEITPLLFGPKQEDASALIVAHHKYFNNSHRPYSRKNYDWFTEEYRTKTLFFVFYNIKSSIRVRRYIKVRILYELHMFNIQTMKSTYDFGDCFV